MKNLTLVCIQLLITILCSQKIIADDFNCNSKKIATVLEELSHYDVIHNCNINVSKYKELIKSNNYGEQIMINYKVEVQDNYYCDNFPKKCVYEMFEVRIPATCMMDTEKVTNSFVYQRKYNIRNELVKVFAQVKYDYFSNIIYFAVGEMSNLTDFNHRVICQPKLFGGNI